MRVTCSWCNLDMGDKEMREACAACFRIIAWRGSSKKLESVLRESGVRSGFGVRCQKVIAKLEAGRKR